MPSPNTSNLLLLLAFVAAFVPCHSSRLPTIAISKFSNITVICALFPSFNNQPYILNCTTLPFNNYQTWPSGSTYYSAIAAGDGFLCALSSPLSGKTSIMRWWDFTEQGYDGLSPAKRVYLGPALAGVASGDTHVCAQKGNGSTECWRWPELYIPPSMKLHMLSIGVQFVCGLLETNSIRCFGNDTGVVGNEPEGTGFLVLAAGSRHACAISAYGELHCWGSGVPVYNLNVSLTGINSLVLGENRTCAHRDNGTVLCWGDGAEIPADIAGAQFISIEARGTALCGILLTNFSLVCWGDHVFAYSNLVFDRVLPGTCVDSASCACDVIPGSGNSCVGDKVICQACKLQYKIVLPQSPTPPRLTNTSRSPTAPGKLINSNSSRRIKLVIIASSVGAGVALIAVLSFLFFWYGKKKHRVHDSGRLPPPRRTEDISVQPMARRLSAFVSKGPSSTVQEFSFQLLFDITGGFSENYKIGSGSFGAVYHATLKDGREVAIKRAEASIASTSAAGAKEKRRDRESAFLSELGLLSRVNHKNLVRLFGFCHERSECLLVYEFMPNGTLHNKIDSPQLSSWVARIRVALDAARGIEYLHTYAVPPIIHRDIKSANILLDTTWAAKVSDFGLSLMNPDGETTGDEPLVSLRAAGTVGYMDPEYYRLQHLTAKSDVYSFGVVLLELLTGCRAVHRPADSGTPRNVVEFAVPHIDADEVHQILDQRLPPPAPCEIEAVMGVAYIAAECVSFHGRDRPSMTEIVGGLERALTVCLARRPITRSETTRSM